MDEEEKPFNQDLKIKGVLSTEELFNQASKIFAETDLYPQKSNKMGRIVAITSQGRQTLAAFSAEENIPAKSLVFLEKIIKKKITDPVTYSTFEKIYALVSLEQDEKNWLDLL